MWIYFQATAANVWTVGYYAPDGFLHAIKDYKTEDQAARRVHYLNGGK